MTRAALLWIVASGAFCAACGGSRSGRADSAADSSATLGAMAADSGSAADTVRATAADTTPPVRRPPAGHRPGGVLATRPASGADTVRGIVAVVGTPVDRRVTLRAGAGAPVRIAGGLSASIGKLSGTEVWASGTRDASGSLVATEFVVRAVDGVPAIDGTLVARDGGKLAIMTRDHTEHPITNPPAALAARVGQRVWITGPLETGAVTFGVVQ